LRIFTDLVSYGLGLGGIVCLVIALIHITQDHLPRGSSRSSDTHR
jgi:hypothetical protein